MIDPAYYDATEPEEAARLAARPRASPTNTLIVIGWTGVKRAYLNLTREEAMARFTVEEELHEPLPADLVEEFIFTDSFGVYDAWGPSNA